MKIIDVEPIISDLIKVRKMWDKDVPYENGIRAGISSALNRLNNAPIVEPLQGEWEFSSVYTDARGSEFAKVKCSCCGYEVFAIAYVVIDGNYCPHCGAYMRGKDNERRVN